MRSARTQPCSHSARLTSFGPPRSCDFVRRQHRPPLPQQEHSSPACHLNPSENGVSKVATINTTIARTKTRSMSVQRSLKPVNSRFLSFF
jgi:hypothetical protein